MPAKQVARHPTVTHRRRRGLPRVDVVPLEAGGEVVSRGLPGVVEHLAGVGGRGHVGDHAALAQGHLLTVAAVANHLEC